MCFLMTPRLLHLRVDSNRWIPYFFRLAANPRMVRNEAYHLEYQGVQSLNRVGSIDVATIS